MLKWIKNESLDNIDKKYRTNKQCPKRTIAFILYELTNNVQKKQQHLCSINSVQTSIQTAKSNSSNITLAFNTTLALKCRNFQAIQATVRCQLIKLSLIRFIQATSTLHWQLIKSNLRRHYTLHQRFLTKQPLIKSQLSSY